MTASIHMHAYDVILVLIPAWLLIVLALSVAACWVWRLHISVSYAPPKAAKVSSVIGWLLLASFYLIQIGIPNLPLVVSVSMIRMVWVFFAANELAQHFYIYKIRHDQPTNDKMDAK